MPAVRAPIPGSSIGRASGCAIFPGASLRSRSGRAPAALALVGSLSRPASVGGDGHHASRRSAGEGRVFARLQWPPVERRSPVAQLAEHPAVNRRVVGSSPTRGAGKRLHRGGNAKGAPDGAPHLVPELVPLRRANESRGIALKVPESSTPALGRETVTFSARSLGIETRSAPNPCNAWRRARSRSGAALTRSCSRPWLDPTASPRTPTRPCSASSPRAR
jgi:hypothetical protein